jgi:hypothetical protein
MESRLVRVRLGPRAAQRVKNVFPMRGPLPMIRSTRLDLNFRPLLKRSSFFLSNPAKNRSGAGFKTGGCH